MKVLYTSQAVRRAIQDIFRSSRARRVAITGYVGEGAETFLPRPSGIQLYCWNTVGTNPEAVRRLKRLGVRCSFSDRVHMKVYWAKGAGCVITSANLSTNAFGRGALKEFGVRLSDQAIDIQRVIESLDAKPAAEGALRRLEALAALEHQRPRQDLSSTERGRSFLEWRNLSAAHKREHPWRLKRFEDWGVLANQRVREEGKSQFGRATPFDWIECDRAVCRDEYLLMYRISRNNCPVELQWLHVDSVHAYKRGESQHPVITHQAVQWQSKKAYRRPPFQLSPEFRRAFSYAVASASARQRAQLMRGERSLRPTPSLLTRIESCL